MSPKLTLQIGAVLAVLVGLASTFAPEQLLSGFGMGSSSSTLVLARDVGVTLIGVGIVNWLLRESTGPALRGLLIGNIWIQVAEAVVNGWEVAAGIIPTQGLGGVALHIILAVMFVLGLRRA